MTKGLFQRSRGQNQQSSTPVAATMEPTRSPTSGLKPPTDGNGARPQSSLVQRVHCIVSLKKSRGK